MSIQSIANQQSTIFSLDEILQGIPEIATEELSDMEETYHSYKEELSQELKTTDRVWLEFHAGQCEQFGKAARSMLYRIVKASVGCPENSIAAANAITILKTMKVSFSCLDLRGVQIPGADLSSAILDRADLSGANLENVDLRYSSLNSTNMPNTKLKDVKFNIPDLLIHDDTVTFSTVSPNNKYLISQDFEDSIYFWHMPSKTLIKKIARPNSSSLTYCSDGKIFTPDGQFLFIYDENQNVDIWSIDNFEHSKKIKIYNKRFNPFALQYPSMCFSPSGNYLITKAINLITDPIKKDDVIGQNTHLKIWQTQKNENKLLDINLKKEVILFDKLYSICFSKKFPVFYGITYKSKEKIICLSIYSVDKLLKIVSKNRLNKFFENESILLCEVVKYLPDEAVSLAILDSDINKNDEELLFIAVDNSIYSVNIVKKNEQSWDLGSIHVIKVIIGTNNPIYIMKKNEENSALKSTRVTKVITEVDTIFDIKILTKTYELIYVCNHAICLYSIKNNKLLSKFRLVGTALDNLTVSPDEAYIYINSSNGVYTYSLEALRNSKYITYEMGNIASCFSSDMHSIISISSNFNMTYNIETGSILRSRYLQKMKSVDKELSDISFSPNAQHILIHYEYPTNCLHIINTKDEKTFLEIPEHIKNFLLSSNSEYLVLVDSEKFLIIYKTTPSKQCIWKSPFKVPVNERMFSPLAISTNFCKLPKVALINKAKKVIVCHFASKGDTLKLLSQRELLVEVSGVVQLIFTENDRKLIVGCLEKIIIWDLEHNQHEEYNIQFQERCRHISHDGTLLVYYSLKNRQLCLWSIVQKKFFIVQSLSSVINKLQISPDNRYVIGTIENGGIYVWKIVEGAFRLLWRTSHNLQAKELILSNNNLEKGVEEELVTKMGAMKLQPNLQAQGLILGDNNLEKDVEEDLKTKMGAINLQSTDKNNSRKYCQIF